jgi:hypothetical protein
MTRHAKSNDWQAGDYVSGEISRLDDEGRGVIGTGSKGVRATGDVEAGKSVIAEITSSDDEYVLAEEIPYFSDTDATLWVQQTADTDSTMGWYPKYPLKTLPLLFHCNLFEEATLETAPRVSKEEPPVLWRKLHSVVATTAGLGILLVILYLIVTLLRGSVMSQWGAAAGQSPVFILLFFIGLGLTFVGWVVFEYLIWLSGAILGGAMGITVGGALSLRLGLSGGQGLLLSWLMMGGGASLVGGLFVLLHRFAIMLGAFFAVASPLAFLLTGGAIASGEVALTSVWLILPVLVAIGFGIVAAILTWVVYKLAIILVTSFFGAAYLVYLPLLAQTGEIGFIFQFVIVFLAGAGVQAFFGFAGD